MSRTITCSDKMDDADAGEIASADRRVGGGKYPSGGPALLSRTEYGVVRLVRVTTYYGVVTSQLLKR